MWFKTERTLVVVLEAGGDGGDGVGRLVVVYRDGDDDVGVGVEVVSMDLLVVSVVMAAVVWREVMGIIVVVQWVSAGVGGRRRQWPETRRSGAGKQERRRELYVAR
ncbi:hypothetical protein Tco_0143355, partial [Tanacetum coccineum]